MLEPETDSAQKKSSDIAKANVSNRIWRGVTLQLFLFAVLPLTILALGVTFGSLSMHHSAMRSLVADRNLRAVQSAAASLSQEISHRGKTLELLSKEFGPTGPAEVDLIRVEKDLEIFEGGTASIDSSGKFIGVVGGQAVQELAALPDWPALWSTFQAGIPGKAQYLPIQKIGDQVFVPVIVRLPDDSALVGLFAPEPLLSGGLAIISQGEPVTILVVDGSYQILFRSGSLSPGEELPTHPGIKNALSGAGGIEYFPTSSGEHVITSSQIQPVGWALMIEESWEDIASPLLQITQYAPLMIIPVLGLSLLAIWFGLRQIVQPLQALEVKARDLAEGNFKTIREPAGGVPEIGQLQETLISMADQLKEAQNSLHSYIGAITDSVESERRSLARDLHDETLQSMIALGQYTQYALHWNQDPKVEKTLDQVVRVVDDGVANLRRMVQGLRPIYIEDLGLAATLAMHASTQDVKDGVMIHFEQVGEERRLKPEVELALYRIAQEALSNVQRHSDARNAWITLSFNNVETVLEIRDDGRGFTPATDPIYYARSGHYGMLGLFERSELIGAKLAIQAAPGKGTLIKITIADRAKSGESAARKLSH